MLAKRLMEPAPELGRCASGARAVSQAVRRALARVPADRFATAAQFAEALASGATTAPAPEKSIAALPFANLSADPGNEYVSDGMSEEFIIALTQLPALRVAARTSSSRVQGEERTHSETGRGAAGEHVLEGSVRMAGTKLRITAQLINVADGYHLWSERYDREMADVFAIQDDIARAIVDTLKVKLLGGVEVPLVKRGTSDPEAYNLYVKRRHFCSARHTDQSTSARAGDRDAIRITRGRTQVWPMPTPTWPLRSHAHEPGTPVLIAAADRAARGPGPRVIPTTRWRSANSSARRDRTRACGPSHTRQEDWRAATWRCTWGRLAGAARRGPKPSGRWSSSHSRRSSMPSQRLAGSRPIR